MERVRQWTEAAPDRFIPGLQFRLGREHLAPDSLRRLYRDGRFAVLAEVTNQYLGIAPGDSLFEPYLAVAEELDVPVGIHVGIGPPGAPYLGFDRYRAALHSPLTLEDVLVRHARLRVYIMHAGWPMLDDLLTVLWAHPQVHVDVGGIVLSGDLRWERQLAESRTLATLRDVLPPRLISGQLQLKAADQLIERQVS